MGAQTSPSAAAAQQEKKESQVDAIDVWTNVMALPCRLSAGIRVQKFTVRDLLRLEPEGVIDSGCDVTAPVPFWVNGVRVGFAEFDAVKSHLAIRINEIG